MASIDFILTLERPDGTRLEAAANRQVPMPDGDQYVIVLRSNVSRRSLVRISVDGLDVSGPGFVLHPWQTLRLEGPYQCAGRFTACREGDTEAFGPDGGRGNPSLGLVEARIQMEAPAPPRTIVHSQPGIWWPEHWPCPTPYPRPIPWPVPIWHRPVYMDSCTESQIGSHAEIRTAGAVFSAMTPGVDCNTQGISPLNDSQAAGTGLSGENRQSFRSASIGSLEPFETTLRLRIVIGQPIQAPRVRPLPGRYVETCPPRPGAL